MDINQNWNRWIFSSASLSFEKIIKTKNSLKFHIDEQQNTNTGDHVEFRFTGPVWRKHDLTNFTGEILINILIRAMIDEVNFHKIHKMTGIVESAFVNTINVFKYGDGPDDDRTVLLGCLELIRKDGKDIETINYGQVHEDISIVQAVVEGHYKIELINPMGD